MHIRRSFSLFWIPLAWVLLAGAQCSVSNNGSNNNTTSPPRVDTEQKISATAGGFNGNLDAGDEFGSALADASDLNADGVTDLAVGTPGNDDGGTGRGAVWILFMNSTGRVDTQQKISDGSGNFSGNLQDNDRFGSALARFTDLNVDGIPDLAVGAPGDGDGGTNRGAVWILFMGRDGRVKSEQKIADGAGGFTGSLNDDEHFGAALASLGDLAGGGIPNLAVGAPGDNDGGTNRGAVWLLFLDKTGRVSSDNRISSTSGGFKGKLQDGDEFGSAVAWIANLNGKGTSDLAVGAPLDDDGGTDEGAIWILFLKETSSNP